MNTDDHPFASLLAISYYHKIADLNREHGVSLVQHIESGEICVRKDMSVYNIAVYEQLLAEPVTGIPRIYHLHKDKENGVLTVIEEYIPGVTLESYLAEKSAMTEQEAIDCCLQLCDVLIQLHKSKPPIIHRDIKPSNIIRREDGHFVLIDLNAARQYVSKDAAPKAEKAVLQNSSTEEERDTHLLGTVGYAAPEQYGFGQSSPCSDIYAMGKLLETMLKAGRAESNAGNHAVDTVENDIYRKQENNEEGRQKSPSCRLRSIIKRCTQMNPEDRFSTVNDLRRALRSAKRYSHHKAAHKQEDSLGRTEKKDEKIRRIRLAAATLGSMIIIVAVTGTAAFTKKGAAAEKATDSNPAAVTVENNKAIQKDIALQTVSDRMAVPSEDNTGDCSFIGSYEGENGDYLVFSMDGTADYYCGEYTELNLPWKKEGEKISVYLPKLHCTIQAKTEEEKSAEQLLFTSSHAGWENEYFHRCASLSPLVIRREKKTYDERAKMQEDGSLLYELGNLQFVLPDEYIDNEDIGDSSEDYSVFFSTDVETGAYSFLFFCQQDNTGKTITKESLQELSENIAGRFYDESSVLEKENAAVYTVAGWQAFQYSFSGKLKSEFGGLKNDPTEGELTLIYEKDHDRVQAVLISAYAGDDVNVDEVKSKIDDYHAMLQNVTKTN